MIIENLLKWQSRLYFLRRLRSFNICWRMFYESVVASAILFAVVCWGSRLRVADANRLNKLIGKASDVVGVEVDTLTAVSDRRMMWKVWASTALTLSTSLWSNRAAPSARDWLLLNALLSATGGSFLPVAIKLYNSSLWGPDFYIKKQKQNKKQNTEQNKTKRKQNCNFKYNYFSV